MKPQTIMLLLGVFRAAHLTRSDPPGSNCEGPRGRRHGGWGGDGCRGSTPPLLQPTVDSLGAGESQVARVDPEWPQHGPAGAAHPALIMSDDAAGALAAPEAWVTAQPEGSRGRSLTALG